MLVPGSEVGHRIGEPVNLSESGKVKPTNETDEPQHNVLGSNIDVLPQPPQQSSISRPVQAAPNPMAPTEHRKRVKTNRRISDLKPQMELFKICARVTGKTGIRPWNNAKGIGKLFSMDLMDESGQIHVTAFGKLVDEYYETIEVRFTWKQLGKRG